MKQKQSTLWHNRNYMLLWSGQALSTIGDAVQSITLPLLILAFTHSVAQAGIVAALQALPFPFLSLPAGALVDRWDRKRVMLVCDAGRAIATGSIPLTLWLRHLTMAQMYLIAIICGVLSTFFSLAETAALPNVVSKEQFPAAMGQNYATSIASGIIGPPIGGFLYAISSPLPFLINAISYLVSVLSLRFIRVKFQQERKTVPRHFLAEIQEGIKWTWHQPLVRFLAFRVAAGNLVYGASTLLLIVLAEQLHAPAFAIGTIFAIDALGGIAATILLKRIQQRLSFAHITIGLGWVAALLFPLYAFAPNVVVLGLISAMLSFALVIFDVTQLSYRASIIPDAIFGRVTSSIRLFTVGAVSLGAALAGLLLQAIGASATVFVCAIYLLILALITTANGDIRRASSMNEKEVVPEQAMTAKQEA